MALKGASLDQMEALTISSDQLFPQQRQPSASEGGYWRAKWLEIYSWNRQKQLN